MGMNPDTNQFEELRQAEDFLNEYRDKMKRPTEEMISKMLPTQLLRPDGTPVPEHWSTFRVGEEIEIKGYVFKVAYIGETSILFEPVGPVTVPVTGEVP